MKWKSDKNISFLLNCYCVWVGLQNLDPMDMNSNHTPVLTDSAPITNSRLHSNLLPYSHTGATFSHGMLLNIPRKKTGILEDVFSCGWLDAMKSSSPPPKYITKDVNHGFSSSESDPYFNWLVLHTPVFQLVTEFCSFYDGVVYVISFFIFVNFFVAKISISTCIFWSNNKLRKRQKNCIIFGLRWNSFTNCW